jgi:tetratricopeptide (TPR) repeat protein
MLPAVLAITLAGCDRTAAVYDTEERGDQGLQQARSKRVVPAEAIEAYRQILDRSPRMALAHLDLALLLHDSAKDYVGAIYHYRRYLELRPDAQKSSMIVGRIQDATRRFAGQSRASEPIASTPGSGLSVDAAKLVEENASLKIEVARLTQEVESARIHGPERVPAVEQPRDKPVAVVEQGRASLSTPATTAAAKHRTHKVRQKETLYSIADTVYGDRTQWKRILDANSVDLNGDPKRLREGMELTIP